MNKVEAAYVDEDFVANHFDHPAWSNAQAAPITKLWSGAPAPVQRHAEARLLWTPGALHVRFICNQYEPLFVHEHAQLDTKTMYLWERDVCELFLAPNPNEPNRYFEYEAAPTGNWIDLTVHITKDGEDKNFEFETGLTVSTQIERNKITIAMRIPWTGALPRPQHGDEARGNLYRCIGVGNERYMAWQPTLTVQPDFHVPDAFGWIRFA